MKLDLVPYSLSLKLQGFLFCFGEVFLEAGGDIGRRVVLIQKYQYILDTLILL